MWKDIAGFEGHYKVNFDGRIKSLPRTCARRNGTLRSVPGGVLATIVSDRGYVVVTLSKNGTNYRRRVNRIVAKHFNANPDNLPEVNHENGNKLDNRACNLKFCTRSYNLKHAYAHGLRKKKRKEKQNESTIGMRRKSGSL